MTNSHISNIEYGATVSANNMLVSGNDIERFGDDGIDYNASDILITKNYIHDGVDLADGAHPDGMQGYPGKFSNVVIDSNRVIRQTDPNLPFPNFLQGIDAFDGDWTNLTVTNNVVVTSSCWGIGFASVHGGKIINNTVLSDLWSRQGADKCRPLLSLGDKTHDGSSSNDVVIRNNLSNGLLIYNLDPNMVMDHNICLTIGGGCRILTFLADGKPNWGISKPGDIWRSQHHRPARGGSRIRQLRSRQVRLRPQAEVRSDGDRSGQSCGGALGGHHRSRARKCDRYRRLPL